jgi:hypothetical protein
MPRATSTPIRASKAPGSGVDVAAIVQKLIDSPEELARQSIKGNENL